MNAALSSLVVGERIVSRCEDGLLEAEYALFDRSEVMLSAAAGGGVLERGYMTTAGFARGRLEEAGLSVELANASLGALGLAQTQALAQSPAVLRVIDQLGPCEAFEGGTFVAATGRYAGTWLDLDALAETAPQGVATLLQALHLLLVLDEVAEDSPVRLLTAGATQSGRPGERTWRKIPLEAASQLPTLLRTIHVPPKALRPESRGRDEADLREDLLRDLHTRATTVVRSRSRLIILAGKFAKIGRSQPPGSSSSVEAGSRPPRPTARSPLPPAPEDPLTLFEEFRRHFDGLHGEYNARAVAEFLSSMAGQPGALPELTVLAARAWLAAGEYGHSRHFAKKLAEDPEAPDSARLTALEILDSTSPTKESLLPPPAAPIKPLPILMVSSSPTAAALPPYRAEPDPPEPARPEPSPSHAPRPAPLPSPAAELGPQPAMAFAILPKQAPLPGVKHPRVARAEIAETLALPIGAEEGMLPAGTRPQDPLRARIAMTRLTRDVGRDYRLWYGTTLKTDLLAIDAMQRHLRRRFPDEPRDDIQARQLEKELLRHGALFSEVLARSLGAEWVDVSLEHPGQWAMLVPPDVRVWPIGRVYRFFRQGHHDIDLVAFYLELETHSKKR